MSIDRIVMADLQLEAAESVPLDRALGRRRRAGRSGIDSQPISVL